MHRVNFFRIVLVVFVLAIPAVALGGFGDTLKQLGKDALSSSSSPSAALSDTDIISGLKEALGNAVTSAVENLGRPGGFLDNTEVKIPVPDSLKPVESVLRFTGQGETVDAFVSSMNSAAEKAVPETADILAGAVQNMSIDDARVILDGPDDAATSFFEKSTRDELMQRIKPLVAEATEAVDVTKDYKGMVDTAQGFSPVEIPKSLSLDDYVTEKGLDGLFTVMAQEEKKIRQNPAARTSEILQKVFGSVQ
jgi:hypothetical protein